MSFLATKGFLVGATVVAFVLAGSAVAWFVAGPQGTFAVTAGGTCGSVFGGRDLEASRNDTGVVAGRRVVTYVADASGLVGGDVRACTDVGDVEVAPASGSSVRIVFVIEPQRPSDAEHVASAVVDAALVAAEGRLLLVASHEERDDDRLEVSIRIEVPASGAYAFELRAGVGDLELEGLLAARAVLETGVGDVEVSSLDATQDVTAATGVGDIRMDLASVQSSKVVGRTGTGDVHVELPRRPDVGYDAHASTGVGRADVEIGSSAEYEKKNSGVGGDARGRTRDFETKPVQVIVEAATGVGDAVVRV